MMNELRMESMVSIKEKEIFRPKESDIRLWKV